MVHGSGAFGWWAADSRKVYRAPSIPTPLQLSLVGLQRRPLAQSHHPLQLSLVGLRRPLAQKTRGGGLSQGCSACGLCLCWSGLLSLTLHRWTGPLIRGPSQHMLYLARAWALRAQNRSDNAGSGSCSHSGGGIWCLNRALTVLPCPQGAPGLLYQDWQGRQAGQPHPQLQAMHAISSPNEVPWGPSHNWISGSKGLHLDISKYPPGSGLSLWPSQTPSHGGHTPSHPAFLPGFIRDFICILQALLTLSCP